MYKENNVQVWVSGSIVKLLYGDVESNWALQVKEPVAKEQEQRKSRSI